MKDKMPTWSDLANHWESENLHPSGVAVFFGYKGDIGAEMVAMVTRALRFAEAHDITYPRDLPKSEDAARKVVGAATGNSERR